MNVAVAGSRERGRRRSSRAWGITRMIASRLGGSVLVVFGVVSITFILARVVAPDPTSLYVSPQADAATRAQVRRSLGLDEPLPVQYMKFLADIFRGDLGTSFSTGQPVTQDLLARMPATLELATYAIAIAVVAAVLLGTMAAGRPGGVLDQFFRVLTIAGSALPAFWIGLMLLWIFFIGLGIAPGPIGRLPIGAPPPPTITGFYLVDSVLTGQWETFVLAARQLVLPTITLAIGLFAPLGRTVRLSMAEALQSDYVRTARAMGIPRIRIHYFYALRNVMLPVLTVLAGVVGFAFAGAILVEGIFAWPGMAQYALNAVQTSDFPAIQGFVLYSALMYVIIYLLVDIAYVRADPRIRL